MTESTFRAAVVVCLVFLVVSVLILSYRVGQLHDRIVAPLAAPEPPEHDK